MGRQRRDVDDGHERRVARGSRDDVSPLQFVLVWLAIVVGSALAWAVMLVGPIRLGIHLFTP